MDNKEELGLLMIEYNEILRKIHLLEEKKDNLRSMIMINIKINDITEFECEGIELTYTMQKRKSLDKAKLEAFLNNYQSSIVQFELENPVEMLRIQSKESKQKYQNGGQ